MKFWVFIICIIISAAAVLSAAVPLIIGKVRLKRALKPIEFYPSRGYSPIDVMGKYYSHRLRAHEIINPLMLHWASRGFVKIEEDCKRGLKITKLKNLEPNADEDQMTNQMKNNFKIEKEFFDGLFEASIEFYTLAAPSSVKDVNKKLMDSCKEKANKRRNARTKKLSALGLVWAEVSIILITIINAVVFGGGGMYAMMLFPIIAVILIKAIPNDEPITTMIKYPFICVWGGVPFGAFLSFAPFDSAVTLSIGMAASVVTVVLSQFIDIRSDRDIAIYGRISAFKQFLLDAEKDQLETLIEENPNYYFDILPYCYILKITKKLKSKFDAITTDGPSWYLGELRDTLMF
ncbi:MAG: DUF2207 domain-containing protein [Clostridiales bacterium]|nr:DUF2207 domain-containing protein [Clostridiales bacterium]